MYMKLWGKVVSLHECGIPSIAMEPAGFNHNSSCNCATNGRRFFTTKGGFIELTSPGTKIGNTVCLIAGTVTPFIMRRKNISELGQCLARHIFMV
jgi:hypothetical protein